MVIEVGVFVVGGDGGGDVDVVLKVDAVVKVVNDRLVINGGKLRSIIVENAVIVQW